MNPELPSLTDWISAGAAAATFVIALIALVYAYFQLKEASMARQQTKDLELERSQPYVVIYTELADGQTIIDLVIKNFGLTAAHDVKVQIEPWPEQDPGEELKIPEVIPFLAPGQEWRTVWDAPFTRLQTDLLPDRHEATVTYLGLKSERIETKAILDWEIYRAKNFLVAHGLHELVNAVREINTTTKKWSESDRGLKIFVRSGNEKDKRERKYRKARAKSIAMFEARGTGTAEETEG